MKAGPFRNFKGVRTHLIEKTFLAFLDSILETYYFVLSRIPRIFVILDKLNSHSLKKWFYHLQCYQQGQNVLVIKNIVFDVEK